jgi:hypothetical protein
MYYEPMWKYAEDHGIELTRTNDLTPTSGNGVICDADYLTPEKIRWFRENSCDLFAFSCIDSAFLSETIRYTPEMLLINRIFSISGIPNTNTSNATGIDSNFQFTAQPRQFLPQPSWENFNFMRERGALQSLPFPIWNRLQIPERKKFEDKRPTVLFRGGGHFLRVLAYFRALQGGFADAASGFTLGPYFNEKMNPQFRYCNECRRIYKQNGYRYPLGVLGGRDGCNSAADWGGELDFTNPGAWNNECPKSFYWLAEQYAKRHGEMDMNHLCNVLNFKAEDEEGHRATVRDCRFFSDCKWEFSIYAAQRFWEAASVGTVNLLPRRANDQDYFPVMKDGEHYVTYADDFSDMTADIDKEKFDYIAENSYQLWKKWIEPTDYFISTNLLRHIFDLILSPRNN